MTSQIIKTASFHAFGTALYIALISSFLYNAERFFGSKEDTFLAPIVMLMLLVFSASLTGSLIFGRPILWYLDGKKKEALMLLIATLGIFFGLTILAVLGLVVLS